MEPQTAGARVSRLFEAHPVAAWLVIALVLWGAGLVTAIVVIWLANWGTATAADAAIFAGVVTLFGLPIAGLWKLKGL